MKIKCIVPPFCQPVSFEYEFESDIKNSIFTNELFSDENFIVCSGLSETMHIFEIKKRLVSDIGAFDNKKKKKSPNSEVQWGTPYQNEASKLRSQEKKKLRKLEQQKKKSTENVDEIADSLNAVQLSTAPVKVNPIQLSHTKSS